MLQILTKSGLSAFTLVELIVVITIVGILSTVGFISYSGYLTGARDSNRISQLTKLSDSLQVYSASKTLPLPDNRIEIIASGSLIAYQGEVGVDVLETIDYTNGGKDPKDDSYYTYYLTKDRKNLQLMALMEEEQSIVRLSPYIAGRIGASFENRYPKVYGKKLGILTYDDASDPLLKNTPINFIQENQASGFIDVLNDTTIYRANIGGIDNESITGTGGKLISSSVSTMVGKSKKSCKEIYDSSSFSRGISGAYVIVLGNEEVKVYCDMETDGGGWTLVFVAKGAALDPVYIINPLAHMQTQSSLYTIENSGNIVYTDGGIDTFVSSINRDMISDSSGSSRNMELSLIESWPEYSHIYWERWIPESLTGRNEYVLPGYTKHDTYLISESENKKTSMNFLSSNRSQSQGWDFTLRSNTSSYPDRVVGSYILSPSGEKFFYDRCQGCRGHMLMNPGAGTEGFFPEYTYGYWRIWKGANNSTYPYNSRWQEYDDLSDGDTMPGWGMYVR